MSIIKILEAEKNLSLLYICFKNIPFLFVLSLSNTAALVLFPFRRPLSTSAYISPADLLLHSENKNNEFIQAKDKQKKKKKKKKTKMDKLFEKLCSSYYFYLHFHRLSLLRSSTFFSLAHSYQQLHTFLLRNIYLFNSLIIVFTCYSFSS